MLAALEPRVGPERLLDLMLRAGPYGDGFGARPEGGLSLAALEAAPHGIDLGPLQPRLPDALRTPSGMIELAPEPLVADVARLRGRAGAPGRDDGPVLVGRRHLRSNNSWMHNLPVLVKGKPRCTLHVHPDDAERYGLTDGEPARAALAHRQRRGRGRDHRRDHARRGQPAPRLGPRRARRAQLAVAAAHAGHQQQLLADELLIDALSGNAVLNGIPVELAPVPRGRSRPSAQRGRALSTAARPRSRRSPT